MKKVTFVLLIAIGLLIGGYFYLGDFPKAVAASFAKEFCSCLYVEELSEQDCAIFAKQIIPVSAYGINKKTHTIWAKGLSFTALAKFDQRHYGCRLMSID